MLSTELFSCGDYFPSLTVLAGVFVAGIAVAWVFVRVRWSKGIRLQRMMDKPL